MANRTPSLQDVKSLSRDEWEGICGTLCATLYQSNRVEDRKGKGNGLDAYRTTVEGIEGFQFKRYDDGFGLTQERKIKENLALAATSCPEEFKQKLCRVMLILNKDLEPSHGKEKGELQRFSDLQTWALTQYAVELDYRGLQWVQTQILKFPYLAPSLFDDPTSAIKNAEQNLGGKIETIETLLRDMTNSVEANERLNSILGKLSREALLHYERGFKLESIDEYSLAITCLKDAERLVDNEIEHQLLHGRILSLLCGIEIIVGQLENALKHGETAVAQLSTIKDKYLLFAKGNFAFAKYVSQNYDSARTIFRELLDEFEEAADPIEVLRTLSHLTELEVSAKQFESALMWGERAEIAAHKMLEAGMHYDVAYSALGSSANALFASSDEQEIGSPEQFELLNDSLSIFNFLYKLGNRSKNIHLEFNSLGQIGHCQWRLFKYKLAQEAWEKTIEGADKFDMGKLAADTEYNLGLMHAEQGKKYESIVYLNAAYTRYCKNGDSASAQDAKHQISRIESR